MSSRGNVTVRTLTVLACGQTPLGTTSHNRGSDSADGIVFTAWMMGVLRALVVARLAQDMCTVPCEMYDALPGVCVPAPMHFNRALMVVGVEQLPSQDRLTIPLSLIIGHSPRSRPAMA